MMEKHAHMVLIWVALVISGQIFRRPTADFPRVVLPCEVILRVILVWNT